MISLLTNGWICYAKRTIIQRYILPLEIKIKQLFSLFLKIENLLPLQLNINQIKDKNVNLKILTHNINIKKPLIIHIGVNKCSQDS